MRTILRELYISIVDFHRDLYNTLLNHRAVVALDMTEYGTMRKCSIDVTFKSVLSITENQECRSLDIFFDADISPLSISMDIIQCYTLSMGTTEPIRFN